LVERVYPLSPPPARFARRGYAARLANRAGGGSKNLTESRASCKVLDPNGRLGSQGASVESVYPPSPPPARFARRGCAARLANRADGGSRPPPHAERQQSHAAAPHLSSLGVRW